MKKVRHTLELCCDAVADVVQPNYPIANLLPLFTVTQTELFAQAKTQQLVMVTLGQTPSTSLENLVIPIIRSGLFEKQRETDDHPSDKRRIESSEVTRDYMAQLRYDRYYSCRL